MFPFRFLSICFRLFPMLTTCQSHVSLSHRLVRFLFSWVVAHPPLLLYLMLLFLISRQPYVEWIFSFLFFYLHLHESAVAISLSLLIYISKRVCGGDGGWFSGSQGTTICVGEACSRMDKMLEVRQSTRWVLDSDPVDGYPAFCLFYFRLPGSQLPGF